MDLKCTGTNTTNLRVVLVEKDTACYRHLRNVIRRRWSAVDIGMAEGPRHLNSSNIHLLNMDLDNALSQIEGMRLGNTLFFFDPLRSIEFKTIRKVAARRIGSYYKTGTEFFIFTFTSDWFLGRDDFAPLPTKDDPNAWSPQEKKTVLEADALFGNRDWRGQILNNGPIYEREDTLIELYRSRLHSWFRYVLPLPFNPKGNQIFHLILCSNFSRGVKATRDFYCKKSGNAKYSPNNVEAFTRFRECHNEVFTGLTKGRKPPQWRILWKTIADHEEGICDCMCSDFDDVEKDTKIRQQLLEWLSDNGYLNEIDSDNAWKVSTKQYKLNWTTVKARLGVHPPPSLKPLSLKPLSLREISQ